MKHLAIFLLVGAAVTLAGALETLRPDNGVDKGNWGQIETFTNGHFARGLQVKSDGASSFMADNSKSLDGVGITGIKLFGPSDTEGITSDYNSEGNWLQIYQCPSEGLIIGLSLNVNTERYDDLAVEDIKALCLNPNGTTTSVIDGLHGVTPEKQDLNQNGIKPPVAPNSFGSFPTCSEGLYVCGLQTRTAPNGLFADNLGLTDATFFCC